MIDFSVFKERLFNVFKLVLLSIVVGLIVGFIGSVFNLLLGYVTKLRIKTGFLFWFLPLAAIIVVFSYRICGIKEDEGTNEIMHAVSSNAQVKGRRSFLIFFSTLVTHLFGASAGREGAALQLGGSLSNLFSRFFKLNEATKRLLVMMGMATCFTTLFGTPIAATIFSMAVVNVGIVYYSALFPCLLSCLIGKLIATSIFKIEFESFIFSSIPSLDVKTASISALVALGAGIVSILFCLMLHLTHKSFNKWFKNPYIIGIIGSLILVGFALIFKGRYQGSGANLIEASIHGDVRYYDFILKLLLTAISIAACFKGGEIVPSLAIGATLGAAISKISGFDLSICVASGMISMFCGITNCPIASIFLGLELFKSYEILPFIGISSAVSYVVSGYIGVYEGQTITHSKYSFDTIDS